MNNFRQALKSIRDYEWALVVSVSLGITTVLALIFGWYWPLPAMAAGMAFLFSAMWFLEQP